MDVVFIWESAPNLQKIAVSCSLFFVNSQDVEENVPKKGVALVDFRTKLSTLKTVSIRKLRGPRSSEMMKELLRFRREVKDVPYETNMVEFVMAARGGNSKGDLTSIFCRFVPSVH